MADGEFTLGSVSKKLGVKAPLNGPYFGLKDWTQACNLVSQFGWSIFLSWDQRDLAGKRFHVKATSCSQRVDFGPSVNSLCPMFYSTNRIVEFWNFLWS